MIYLHDTSSVYSVSVNVLVAFVLIETSRVATLFGKELVSLLCVVQNCFVMYLSPPGVSVGTINLTASIPDSSIFVFQ